MPDEESLFKDELEPKYKRGGELKKRIAKRRGIRHARIGTYHSNDKHREGGFKDFEGPDTITFRPK